MRHHRRELPLLRYQGPEPRTDPSPQALILRFKALLYLYDYFIIFQIIKPYGLKYAPTEPDHAPALPLFYTALF